MLKNVWAIRGLKGLANGTWKVTILGPKREGMVCKNFTFFQMLNFGGVYNGLLWIIPIGAFVDVSGYASQC